MKVLTTVAVFILLTKLSVAQLSVDKLIQYSVADIHQNRILNSTPSIIRLPGERMVGTGKTLTLVGVPLLIAGIVTTATTDMSNVQFYSVFGSVSDSHKKANAQFFDGVLLSGVGLGLTIAGVIIWPRGLHKLKRYREKQNVTLQMKGTGLHLSIKF